MTRMKKSVKKATMVSFVGVKSPLNHAFMNAIRAKKNMIPAAPRASRSFRTRTG